MKHKDKILIVEDDHLLALSLRSLIYKNLSACDCWLVDSLMQVSKIITEIDFDLIILDRELLDGDGLEVIEMVRQSFWQTKFLILSHLGSVKERELGLMSGAHDYLPKPFSQTELLQKIKILLQMSLKAKKKVFHYDDNFVFSTQNMTLEVDGQVNDLTASDCQLLSYLLEHNNALIPKENLIDLIWHESRNLTSNAINAKIYRLRKKMGRFGNLLQAIYNYGYRLNMTNKLMTVTSIA